MMPRIRSAVDELRDNGFLSAETLRLLSHEEYLLVNQLSEESK